jgi:Mg2+ and Co2+ transporter CorA
MGANRDARGPWHSLSGEGIEGAAADLFRLRKELLRVPPLLAPASHVLEEVLRRERMAPDALRPYFADVQDHAIHVLVPNFVASIYGMNFARIIPASDWEYGFVVVVAFLLVMIAWGFIHSRLLRWL